ncbi:MAG: UDP-3-O-(3-hydroxymyristoyl)glucosamine N-acyltransferase [Paludibacterium sp.]|uniref:UDP-3-O-(3-hydroxymyristoyl)glucosamine N-acyltransferase n=1 Tax=Paludibacterium sp. TaxID=1917523 RepID=UPI002600B50B|nr:UDP-3-O-(3-hydroxymyristoyl)glucosamine N-acyltransferase [Paludibacterium sp.]MBV8046523.1 UDP-3-O-(3-hydroxymyristoyl)glucosamine N-acyltransferase [Paludibacterium sp.]MBV8646755.1 UDP-3-O-(3-hydroxymyristoyl)glucosamine N-acyltransferase [Paludibacterium sp.]
MSYTLSEIVARLGGERHGADVAVARVAPLDMARPGELSFITHTKYRHQLEACEASAVIVSPRILAAAPVDRPVIVTPDPYLYFAKVATLFNPPQAAVAGVHGLASLGAGSKVAASAEVREHVSIGARAVIGERCRLMPGVVVGDDCVLGDDVVLYPNVTVYHNCVIGHRVTVHSGAVIGADGFGLAKDGDAWFKIPQTGRVLIGDDVEVGANTTIDRGALADTVIGRGAKIDNLVQIAHNVHIGEHTAIAGCVGIAGSTRIGAYCTIGGAAMFVGHIEIADRTHIGGGTLVSKSIRQADSYASSYPLSTMKDWLSNAVHLRHLDDLVGRVKQLEKELRTIQNKEVPNE